MYKLECQFSMWAGDGWSASRESNDVMTSKPQRWETGVAEIVLNKDGSSAVHRAIRIPKAETPCGRKPCVYCNIHGVRTKTGSRVIAKYMCDKCKLPFCVKNRKCFFMYHQDLQAGVYIVYGNASLCTINTCKRVSYSWWKCLFMYNQDLQTGVI